MTTTPKTNGKAAEPRRTYSLSSIERDVMQGFNAKILQLQNQANAISNQRQGALMAILRQQKLDGNYRLSDDLTTLAPVEEQAPARPQAVTPKPKAKPEEARQ